jgi:hypothetical protein
MRVLVLAVVSVMVLLFGVFPVMRALQVREDAQLFLAPEGCPVQLDRHGSCVLAGGVTEDLVSGDSVITLADKSVWMFPRSRVRGLAWEASRVRYQAFPGLPLVVLAALGALGVVALLWPWRRRLA